MDVEVEKQIAECERKFDLAKARVRELELALDSAERSLNSAWWPGQVQRQRQKVVWVDRELAAARAALATSREELEAAWALRNGSQQNGEYAANSVEGKHDE